MTSYEMKRFLAEYQYTPFAIQEPIPLKVRVWPRKERFRSVRLDVVVKPNGDLMVNLNEHKFVNKVAKLKDGIATYVMCKLFVDRFSDYADHCLTELSLRIGLSGNRLENYLKRFEYKMDKLEAFVEYSKSYSELYRFYVSNAGWYAQWNSNYQVEIEDEEKELPYLSDDVVIIRAIQIHKLFKAIIAKMPMVAQLSDLEFKYSTPDNGYIYLYGPVEGQYKIGKSNSPERRDIEIVPRTILPIDPDMIHLIPTNQMDAAETILQERYADLRTKGEWFNLTPDHITEICAIESMMFDWLPVPAPAVEPEGEDIDALMRDFDDIEQLANDLDDLTA